MRLPGRRRSTRPPPGEFPRGFTAAWMRGTLPTTSPAEARAALAHLRLKGWTETELATLIMPYMPRGAVSAQGVEAATDDRPQVSLPRGASTAWLDQHLPAMDRGQLRLVVDELERRGWSPADVAVAVLPHLLPKLPREDADAILTGLGELGLSDEDVAVLASRT